VVRQDRRGPQAFRALWRSRQRASDIAAETLAESATEEVGVIATGAVSAPPNTSAPLRVPVTADAIGQAQVKRVISIQPDQQEIQRRRELVRTLFNDFWSGRDDKPETFADRLDQAEIISTNDWRRAESAGSLTPRHGRCWACRGALIHRIEERVMSAFDLKRHCCS
jgi:hypothetical protein